MPLARDPLLTAAKALLAFIMGVVAFAAACLLIGAGAVPFLQADILAELSAEAEQPVSAALIPAIVALLVAVAALMGLLIAFLQMLWRIVASVGEGDPFIPQNATRLNRMAWLVVAGEVLGLAIGALVTQAARMAAAAGLDADVDIDIGTGGSGVLLILVLFILARVFRHGTALRDEVEGTV